MLTGIYRNYAFGWNYEQFSLFAEQLKELTNHHPVIQEFLNTPLDEEIEPNRCLLIASHLRSVTKYPEIKDHAPAMLAIASEMERCAKERRVFVVE